jgi:dolichyl-diphosphooligosaccharide---protein glycosyltransferase
MIVKRKMKLDKREYIRLLVKLTAAGLLFLTVIVFFVVPSGYFGPISSRVRGLFLKHTRTGNPLVDSVAEHQPASNRAYYQYLQCICYFAPIGFMMILSKPTDSRTFLILYGLVAYFFSAKMVRLVLLLGPIASSLGGIAIANMLEWSYEKIVSTPVDLDQLQQNNRIGLSKREAMKMKKNKKKMKGKNRSSSLKNQNSKLPEVFRPLFGPVEDYFETMSGKVVAKMVAGMMVMFIATNGYTFFYYSIAMAKRMSNPSLMYEATLRNGEKIMIDDYREAYWWLRDNTPEDSRVMAWWDYGYQITGIGERTTIADGNTWNHEHIATLGRCLVSPEEEAHQIVRHLADYVLVWTGGGGDDLAKSPHMARISNSVYSDICPGDPTCRKFGFMDRNRTPKPMMAASLLYKLHSHNKRPGVSADPDLFEEVYV